MLGNYVDDWTHQTIGKIFDARIPFWYLVSGLDRCFSFEILNCFTFRKICYHQHCLSQMPCIQILYDGLGYLKPAENMRVTNEFQIKRWKRMFCTRLYHIWLWIHFVCNAKDRISKCLISAMFINLITSTLHFKYCCSLVCTKYTQEVSV